MVSSCFSTVRKFLVTCRDNDPDSWKGSLITRLAHMYDACRREVTTMKTRRQVRVIRRLYDSEVEKHLTLGVGYGCLAEPQASIAEFGTMSGHTANIIAKTMAVVGPRRKLHLFDSFRGLPTSTSPVDLNNPCVVAGWWAPGCHVDLNPRELMRVCSRYLPKERIIIHEGWFCDTLPKLPDDTRFSMLHVDSDLYQSAIDVLDVCFSRGFVAEGAIIFFDDWNCAAASPELGERRAWSEIVEKYSVKYSDEGSYCWHGHKLIVHSYKQGFQ